MKIEICVSSPDDALEVHRPKSNDADWKLMISGYWGEDAYHSGYVAYYLASTAPGTWVVNRVERNAELDDITQEDVDERRLNDDQLQALWGRTLEEAQDETYERIVARLTHAQSNMSEHDIAKLLYSKICEASGKEVDELDAEGLVEF